MKPLIAWLSDLGTLHPSIPPRCSHSGAHTWRRSAGASSQAMDPSVFEAGICVRDGALDIQMTLVAVKGYLGSHAGSQTRVPAGC